MDGVLNRPLFGICCGCGFIRKVSSNSARLSVDGQRISCQLFPYFNGIVPFKNSGNDGSRTHPAYEPLTNFLSDFKWVLASHFFHRIYSLLFVVFKGLTSHTLNPVWIFTVML